MANFIKSVYQWKMALFKKYPAIILFFVFGVLFWLIQYKLQRAVGHVIPWKVTTFKLTAYLFLFIAVYLLLLKKKKYVFANIVIIAPLLLLVEFTCFALLGFPDKPIKLLAPPDLPDTDIVINVGPLPEANDSIHDIKEGSFEVDYLIDKYHRRITPGYDSSRSQYSLFFGCSIAYGYGLNGNETLPYYYQEVSQSNSKNYGYTGSGTNQMLARLQFENLADQVEEEDGVAYYIFFWDHIRRAIATKDRYMEWVSTAPYFYMDNGELKRDKTFFDGRSGISSFYEFAYYTSIVEYFKIDFPSSLNDTHYDLISEMVAESKSEYQKQFGNDKFYLVIYPTYKEYEDDEMNQFKSYLDKKAIDYIDLTEFMQFESENSLPDDPHPNAKTNKVLAEELWRRVKTFGSE